MGKTSAIVEIAVRIEGRRYLYIWTDRYPTNLVPERNKADSDQSRQQESTDSDQRCLMFGRINKQQKVEEGAVKVDARQKEKKPSR